MGVHFMKRYLYNNYYYTLPFLMKTCAIFKNIIAGVTFTNISSVRYILQHYMYFTKACVMYKAYSICPFLELISHFLVGKVCISS